jgi:hypothetical protein
MGIWFSRRAARAPSGAHRLRNGAIAALLGALVAGCMASGPPPGPAAAGAVPTIAFDSIDGPPAGIFDRLVQNLSAEAETRQIAVVSRAGRSNYRVRGYLAAQVVRGRTHIAWVWDVYDDDRLRTLRITGEEAGGRRGGDPWDVADEAMLRKIARASMDGLAALLGAPNTAMGGPYEPAQPGAAIAAALR